MSEINSRWNFRLAEPTDSKAFANWAALNPLVDRQDIQDGVSRNNPTVLTFVAEKDGVPVAFAPVYVTALLAHLGFNPDARGVDKMKALDVLKDGVSAFMVQFGIREIQTFSKPEYPVAQWALDHDFKQESRSVFRLNLNEQMELAGAEVK